MNVTKGKWKDNRSYAYRCFKNSQHIIDDFVKAGAEYNDSLDYAISSDRTYYLYVDDDNKICRVSMFDCDFKSIMACRDECEFHPESYDVANMTVSVENWKTLVNRFDYDCTTVCELYEINETCPRNEIQGIELELKGMDGKKLGRMISPIATNSQIGFNEDLFNEFLQKVVELHGIQFAPIITKNTDSLVSGMFLIVNGNNGFTIASKDSLPDVIKAMELIESYGGRSFIASTSYHSDVFYYNIKFVFWPSWMHAIGEKSKAELETEKAQKDDVTTNKD